MARGGEAGAQVARYRFPGRGQVRPPARRARRPRARPTAFLTVQEGCDKFCAFCVVPYTRGAEVVAPGRRGCWPRRATWSAQGVREITLLGQNVNAYHGAGATADWALARLIRALAEIDGLERHPLHHLASERHGRRPDRGAWRRAEADALSAPAGAVGVGPHPEGDEPQAHRRALSAAGRADPRGAARYRCCRAISSSASPARPTPISTTTLALVRGGELRQAYTFKYSARPGTPAAERAPVAGRA